MYIRYFFYNRKRNISMSIGIAVSVVLLLVVYSVNNVLQNNYINNFKSREGDYNLYIDNLKNTKEIINLEGIMNIGTEEFIGGVENNAGLYQQFSGIEKDYLKVYNMEIISGRMPENDNEIVVERWVAQNMGIQQDEEVSLKFTDSMDANRSYNRKFKVTGILSDSKYYKRTGYMHVYTKFQGNNLYKTRTYISVNDEVNIPSLKNEISKLTDIPQKNIKENKILNDLIKEENKFTSKEVVMCISILMMNIRFINGVYSISIVKRKKEFGIMRTLGIDNKNLFKMIFMELCIVGVVGIIMGLILTFFIMNILKSDTELLYKIFGIEKYMISDFENININYKWIVYTLIPIVSALFVAVIQYRDIKRKSPIELVINEDNSEKSLKTKFKEKNMDNILSKISYNRMIMNKKKTMLILFILSIGAILFTSINYRNDMMMYHNNRLFSDPSNGDNFDINMNTMNFNKKGIDEKSLNYISNIKNNDGSSAINEIIASSQKLGRIKISGDYKKYDKYLIERDKHYKISYNGILVDNKNEKYIKASVFTYNDETMKKVYGIDNNKDEAIMYLPEEFKKDNIFVGNDNKAEFVSSKEKEYKKEFIYGYKNYDEEMYKINDIQIKNTTSEYLYSGPYYTSDDDLPQIIVSNSLYEKMFGEIIYDNINILVNEGVDSEFVSNSIIKYIKGLPIVVSDIAETRKENEIIDQKTKLFFNFVVRVIYVLTIINSVNMISDILISRKDEFKKLSILGASKNQLRTMVLKETIIYSVISFGIAFIISILFEVLYYISHMNKGWLFPDFYIEYKSIIFLGVVNFIVILITAKASTNYLRK